MAQDRPVRRPDEEVNLYCNGEVSVDGHSWCDAAIATDFNERSWILSYSSHGKLPGNDEMQLTHGGLFMGPLPTAWRELQELWRRRRARAFRQSRALERATRHGALERLHPQGIEPAAPEDSPLAIK